MTVYDTPRVTDVGYTCMFTDKDCLAQCTYCMDGSKRVDCRGRTSATPCVQSVTSTQEICGDRDLPDDATGTLEFRNYLPQQSLCEWDLDFRSKTTKGQVTLQVDFSTQVRSR
jgi:hypothetical protein